MRYLFLFLIICTSPIYSIDADILKKSLEKYDPIVNDKKELVGTLHFPEVQSVLPDFYKQLFERVQIECRASKKEIKIELKGKNEFLKDMVRQEFLKFEDQLKSTIRQALVKDPLYRLNKIIDQPENYISKSRKYDNNTNFTFLSKVKEATELMGPSKLSFDINASGQLKSLTIIDWKYTTEITFVTKSFKNKYYFSELNFIQSKNGISKYRKINIDYKTVDGVYVPVKVSLSQTDQRGQLLKVSGNLNPISIYFKKSK
jgi:hypothetical protein